MILKEIKTLELADVTQTINSETVDLSDIQALSIVCNITSDAPAAGVFTADFATNLMTKATHGFKTGLKVRVSTAGVLPDPLLAATDYFVIRISASTFKLATSYVNAVAGTAITLIDDGTGAHTITPTAIAGGLITVQYSLDETTWVNVAAGTAITASATFALNIDRPAYPFMRLAYTLTAGQLTVVNTLALKQ